MIRPLLLVFVAGSAIALACGVTYGALHNGDDRNHASAVEAGPVETRDFAWTGQTLKISFPAQVTYVQGPESKMIATGRRAVLDKLKVEDGAIRLAVSCTDWSFSITGFGQRDHDDPDAACHTDLEDLKITVTAPSVSAFEVSGVGHLEIQNYDQPTLGIDVSGAAKAKAAGKAGKLDLDVSGASRADLEDLAVTDAKVDASGASHATIKATGKVEADASGASSVELKAKPASLQQSVSGASHIDQP